MISPAPAKINLCLFVGGTRAGDGKHEVVSVMQSVDLVDDVELTASDADSVVCAGVPGANIVDAALAAFREVSGEAGPVSIRVEKRIPVAAGMAGGSADAGAVLRLLNAQAAAPLDEGALYSIAAALGADVPAQLLPGRSLATGAGEVVEQLPAPEPFGVVVLPHDQPLATSSVFAEFARLGLARSQNELAASLEEVRRVAGDIPDELVVNDLQPAAISLCRAVRDNLERMRDAGAEQAMVSGSGPTVIGLCPDRVAAERVAAALGAPAVVAEPWTRGAVFE